MGKGGDAQTLHKSGSNRSLKRTSSVMEQLKGLQSALQARQKLQTIKSDIQVLKTIWFKKLKESDDHQERLEQFYGPQANCYDAFRSRFLWGRKPMLAACAARLQDQDNLVWVDLGAGTGENILLMTEYMNLKRFKHVYVVDLCPSLCEQARKKVKEQGWSNVTVVEGDACEFVPPEGTANLVTFSYSLSMIPPYCAAVDRAISYLDAEEGLLGVCDFYVSAKYDLPLRQMSWARRFFWSSIFDMDSIHIGPERRHYLDHQLSRVWEYNDEGSIPWVPYLRAPYYVWVGRIPKLETLLVENKVETPALFPPTFLYTQSWEDPVADEPYLQVKPDDVCLTLTSGGCNSLNLCLNGAKAVYSVDCNPAQSALLELKQIAIRELGFEDFWALFGDGKHPEFDEIFEKRLAPFMSTHSIQFWKARMHYFRKGLYYQGGMGGLVWCTQVLVTALGLNRWMSALANAPTLESQKKIWESAWVVRLLRHSPEWLLNIIADVAGVLLFNRVTLWFGGGVPINQYQLIKNDKVHMSEYVSRCFDGVGQHSHIRKDNYFYYNCLTGKFARDNCPEYLKEKSFKALKEGLVDNLYIVNGFFLPTLRARKYSKVILMDHVDWLSDKAAKEVADALGQQVVPGGRVILRSAALKPRYISFVEKAGFDVRCVQRIDQGYMDRVNMYASFYVAVKKDKRA